MTGMTSTARIPDGLRTTPSRQDGGIAVLRCRAQALLLGLLLLLFPSGPATAGTPPARPTASWPVHVPDTGQERCYDNLHRITCPPPGAPYYGQDAEYVINPPQCEKKVVGDATLLIDRVTGLTWQVASAESELDWSAALDYTEELTLAGWTDWRLPESRELRTIMTFAHPDREEKTQDCRFPLPAASPCFWSATTRKFPALDAQSVCLGAINQVRDTNKERRLWVRAVRGPRLPGPSFRVNGDGTVTDLSTGLMWQQSETRPMTWQQALAFCEELELAGHGDWRLPSIRELQTLVEAGPGEPAVDEKIFPGCRPEPYWSSTTRSERPAFAWTMDFATGREYDGGYKARLYPVRAVRGGLVIRRRPGVEPRPPHPAPRPGEEEIRPFPRPGREDEFLEPRPLEMEDRPSQTGR